MLERELAPMVSIRLLETPYRLPDEDLVVEHRRWSVLLHGE